MYKEQAHSSHLMIKCPFIVKREAQLFFLIAFIVFHFVHWYFVCKSGVLIPLSWKPGSPSSDRYEMSCKTQTT